MSAEERLAVVMTGGGARAAYQVGFLRFLARRYPELRCPILTGVSAGAINAAFLAGHEGPFPEAVEALRALWLDITPSSIFRTDSWALLESFLRWAAGFITAGSEVGPRRRGFVDTAPLHALLERELPNDASVLTGIRRNIAAGNLRSVAITTTNYGTGQSITWVQGRRYRDWSRPHRRSQPAELTTKHVLASAALPLIFPAVELADGWHGDGGIRLTAPLSPAKHLGASRILAVSNRYQRSPIEARTSVIAGYPPPAQVIGTLMNAIFLDMLDFDARTMHRISDTVGRLPSEARRRLHLRAIETLVLRPSADLGRLAARFEVKLPRAFRYLTRGFGTRETQVPDSLSLLMFQPDYIHALISLGEADARRRSAQIHRFLRGLVGAGAGR